MRRVPTCLLSSHAAPRVSHGHDPDAFVEIGSLTKVLTGTLLLRLAAAGTLDPDDPVDRFLNAPAGTGITLRHLAEHTSGLPRLPPGLTGRDPYAAFTDAALRALTGRLDALTTAAPGASTEYSNLGYALLGAALVAAGARPYEELVREHVLQPLGVEHGVAVRPPGRRLVARGLFGRELRPWTMDGAILPAGGMWATPRATADLVVGLLVEGRLGAPAPTWQSAAGLTWHNGATRNASAFAGAFPDGQWVVVHRLGGSPERTDAMAVEHLRETRRGRRGEDRPGEERPENASAPG
ncbi:serine hydrolase domain-containing protein [Streptomyces sp. NPDC001922]|uniref:serine hydrolase domain-containing protein n=1 Tax=Streptomyces sp. NPDC001922 TaxID=3364624 RepID=UPI0036A91BC5